MWKGSPSQLTNIGVYLLCLLTCFLVVPLFIALWWWIKTKCRVYELTTQRLLFTTGVFSKDSDTLELYRVKDIHREQPFWYRVFGLCNITLHTSDNTNPLVVLTAVPANAELQDLIRKYVELRRDVKGVKEVDFDSVKSE